MYAEINAEVMVEWSSVPTWLEPTSLWRVQGLPKRGYAKVKTHTILIFLDFIGKTDAFFNPRP